MGVDEARRVNEGEIRSAKEDVILDFKFPNEFETQNLRTLH